MYYIPLKTLRSFPTLWMNLCIFLISRGLSFEQIPEKFPALICTLGQLCSAMLEFITKCFEVNPHCSVWYSGDLDLQEVQMMREVERKDELKAIRRKGKFG